MIRYTPIGIHVEPTTVTLTVRPSYKTEIRVAHLMKLGWFVLRVGGTIIATRKTSAFPTPERPA